jgi:hypothetical protein
MIVFVFLSGDQFALLGKLFSLFVIIIIIIIIIIGEGSDKWMPFTALVTVAT